MGQGGGGVRRWVSLSLLLDLISRQSERGEDGFCRERETDAYIGVCICVCVWKACRELSNSKTCLGWLEYKFSKSDAYDITYTLL